MPAERDQAVLALDIGGTKLAAGVVRATGEIISQAEVPTLVQDGPEQSIRRLLELGERVRQEAGNPPLCAAGIACGGPLDTSTGRLLGPPNLPGWYAVPIVDIVAAHFSLPANLENDGNAGMLAEHRFGAARNVNNAAYITLSSGVGGGVMLDGDLFHGQDGNAFEIGHLSVKFDGLPCKCGNLGCLETYASGNQLAARAQAALAAGAASSLRQLSKLTGKDVVAAAAAGDPLAVRLWTDTTAAVGSAVTSITHLFNPELITIGGGVSQAGDQLLQPVVNWLDQHAFAHLRRQVRVELTPLRRNMGVLSAAAVALRNLNGAN